MYMRFTDLLYPRKCCFCKKIVAGRPVCADCMRKLDYVKEPICKRCGKPQDGGALCEDCAGRSFTGLDGGRALWVYDDITRKTMEDFKYGGATVDAGFFADELILHAGRFFEEVRPEVIVPIPIHRRREWFRGYNQAGVLALELGARLDIPVKHLLKRIKYTKPLKTLSPEERKSSLAEAFSADDSEMDGTALYDRALLVDDIYTTGATMDVCASLLKSAGIDKVYACYLCIGVGS